MQHGKIAEGESSNGDESDDNIDDNGDDDGEPSWEPPVVEPALNGLENAELTEDHEMGDEEAQQARNIAEQQTRRQPIVVQFARKRAGQVLSNTGNQYNTYKNELEETNEGMYAPFASRMEWEFAKWAKTRGPGSNAVSELLRIEGVSHFIDRKSRSSYSQADPSSPKH